MKGEVRPWLVWSSCSRTIQWRSRWCYGSHAEWEHDFKLKNDPHVTRVGRFLRKTSLDELPQIFNVLKGEMSLVGLQPIVRKEVLRFGHI